MTSEHSLSKREMILFAALVLCEGAFAVILLAFHIRGERPFEAFLASTPGLAVLCASAVFGLGGTVVLYQWFDRRRSSSRSFRLVVMMNLITVMLLLLASEIIVRAGTTYKLQFEAVGGTLVLTPKSWEATKARYRALLDRAQGYVAFLVPDELLGWRVGPNRVGSDGLYWSSAEGIRAPGAVVSFQKTSKQTDIATIGDSFTFGEEVRHEDTYPSYLNGLLGSEFRVLNFGVPGYGLDQMLLRYQRDVRAWRPKIVLLGFISHDLERTLWVYPFLGDPAWDFPFSAPRFILQDGQLVNVNEKPLPPEEIFSKESILQLPLLKYQKGYRDADWQSGLAHFSYLVRLVVSWFPAWSPQRPEISEDAHVSINAEILSAFAREVRRDGAIPMVVYLPRWEELQNLDVTLSSWGKEVLNKGRVAHRVLDEAGLTYIDPTACLLELDSPDLAYQPGRHHYSPKGNAAVAKCVRKALDTVLTPVSSQRSGPVVRRGEAKLHSSF